MFLRLTCSHSLPEPDRAATMAVLQMARGKLSHVTGVGQGLMVTAPTVSFFLEVVLTCISSHLDLIVACFLID